MQLQIVLAKKFETKEQCIAFWQQLKTFLRSAEPIDKNATIIESAEGNSAE